MKMRFTFVFIQSTNQIKKVEITEIVKFIYPEDRMMVAVINETSGVYVDKIINGTRRVRTAKAKAIVADLRKLAEVNKQAADLKKRIAKTKKQKT